MISAVSAQLGIPIPTIRSWERRYGFPAPARTGGQHRRYSTDEVELLHMLRDEITRGHRAGDAVALVRGREIPGEPPRPRLLDAFIDAAMRLDPSGAATNARPGDRDERGRGRDRGGGPAGDARARHPVDHGNVRHRA